MTDMLERMTPFLDKHMVLGLLGFYASQGVDVHDAIDQVIKTTPLEGIDGRISASFEAQVKQVTEKAKPALDAFFETTTGPEIAYSFNLAESDVEALRVKHELSYDFLKANKRITHDVMGAVLRLAYLYYDCGRCGNAAELLAFCRSVSDYTLDENSLDWGMLMCSIGTGDWQAAAAVAEQLRRKQNPEVFEEEILRDVGVTTARKRAWLLHWALFPFFKGGLPATTQLLNFVFDYKTNFVYQSVVETAIPHYLRYICAAAVLNRQRRSAMKHAYALLKVVHEYSDPITKLVEFLCRPSLEEVFAILPKVRETAINDFFLHDLTDDLVESAKRLAFTRYLSTHAVVSIPYVASQLNVSIPDAEVWLVNLISETKQRAKIDSVAEQMLLVSQVRPIQQVVLDKMETVDRR